MDTFFLVPTYNNINYGRQMARLNFDTIDIFNRFQSLLRFFCVTMAMQLPDIAMNRNS